MSWWTQYWFTIWNGVGWLNPRKLTNSAAEDWHITQYEAMGGHQPLSHISLWRWNGSAWEHRA